MRKLVNGKEIDIQHWDIIEKAFTHGAVKRSLDNSTEIVRGNFKIPEEITDYISTYDRVYWGLPFLLKCIESDIKYVTIANYMKTKHEFKEGDIWVDNSLYIKVGKGRVLQFIGNTWGIVEVEEKENEERNGASDNKYNPHDEENNKASLNLDDYKDEIEYKQFKWALDNMSNENYQRLYYDVFMPDLVDACDYDYKAVAAQVADLLAYKPVYVNCKLSENSILQVKDGSLYYIDVFNCGVVNDGKKPIVDISSVNINKNSYLMQYEPQITKLYDYAVFKKSKVKDGYKKVKEIKDDRFTPVYQTIIGKMLVDEKQKLVYKGVIIEDKIVFQINEEIFICDRNSSSPIQLGEKVIICGIKNNTVYFYTDVHQEQQFAIRKYFSMDCSVKLKEMKIQYCRLDGVKRWE